MSDMRIVVAGAGGRMGRTLVKAVTETSGLALAGAIEQPGSRFVGHDAGELCGVGKIGIAISSDAASALLNADAVIDFTVPAATRELVAKVAERGIVHIIGTTGFSDDDEARIKAAAAKAVIVKSGNMSLGVNLLAALVKRVAKTLDERIRYRSAGDASQQQDRRAVGHRASARPRRGGRPRHRSRKARSDVARRPYRRAQGRRYRLCDAARRHAWSASTA